MARVTNLGIIPDGGRRWARINQCSLISSYRQTFSSLEQIIRWYFGEAWETLSIYLLSKENLKRDRSDLEVVLQAECEFLEEVVPTLSKEMDFGVRVVGETALLPSRARRASIALGDHRAETRRALFLCMAYCPFDEIQRAIIKCEPASNSEGIWQALDMNRRLDLVIRSGGAVTLSNFLPLQSAYARLIFVDDLFNDLARDFFQDIVSEHERADLKYGE